MQRIKDENVGIAQGLNLSDPIGLLLMKPRAVAREDIKKHGHPKA